MKQFKNLLKYMPLAIGLAVCAVIYSVVLQVAKDNAMQNAIKSLKMVAVNAPNPGGTLKVKTSSKFGTDCDLTIITYAFGDKEVFPLSYAFHPKEFLSEIGANSETSYIVPISIPVTTAPGEYQMVLFARYSCNPIQRLFPNSEMAEPVAFKVLPNVEDTITDNSSSKSTSK